MSALAKLTEAQRQIAQHRYDVIRPALTGGVPLARAAREAGVGERTARRWREAYDRGGLIALAPKDRKDHGRRRTNDDLVAIVEGLALRRPAPTTAHVHRTVTGIAEDRGLPAPSYSTVRQIIVAIDPGLRALAHEGAAAYRDRFELALRRETSAPNAIWQADHTQLDVMILDQARRPVRPWLTIVMDDYSRAVAGYFVFVGAPSAHQTSLALRQAIWRKDDPAWSICGLPDVLYTDNGSDFASHHLRQVAADLHVELTFSTPGVPQGRGKIERFFGTLTTELLPMFPGHLAPARRGAPPNLPALSLGELDAAIGSWITKTYHGRKHSQTGERPLERWAAGGWIPRMPDSLEQLDLLLVAVAKARIVHRDGIRFQGLRYVSLTLAAYVGEEVQIRYDPRDAGEIRVFHGGAYLCTAVSPDLAGVSITIRDLQATRNARRRELRAQLRDRRSLADAALPPLDLTAAAEPEPVAPSVTPIKRRLRLYEED